MPRSKNLLKKKRKEKKKKNIGDMTQEHTG